MTLDSSVFWTDSTSVLKYIKNETKRFQTFVANRISAIREMSEIKQWRYIHTKENPADLASRGLNATALVECHFWKNGPAFLQRAEQEWPTLPLLEDSISVDDPEVKRDKLAVNVILKEQSSTSAFIHHYSSWSSLLRAVAWFLRVKGLLRELSMKRKEVVKVAQIQDMNQNKQERQIKERMTKFKTSLKSSNLSLEDVRNAESTVVRFCQQQEFKEDIKRLVKGLSLKKDSSILRLDLKLDKGLLRVGGRLRRSSMPEETKRPALLPKNDHVSKLLLKDIHQKIGHSGRNYILSQLRQKYWIPCANSLARKVISECVACRRFHSALGDQKMQTCLRTA